MKLGGRRLLLKFRRYSRSGPIYGFAGKSRIAEGRCDLREIGDSVAMQLSSYGSELLERRQLRCGVEQVRRGAGAAWSRCGVEQVRRGKRVLRCSRWSGPRPFPGHFSSGLRGCLDDDGHESRWLRRRRRFRGRNFGAASVCGGSALKVGAQTIVVIRRAGRLASGEQLAGGRALSGRNWRSFMVALPAAPKLGRGRRAGSCCKRLLFVGRFLFQGVVALMSCLFAGGTLRALLFVASLQRSSELRSSQLRSGLRLRAATHADRRGLMDHCSILANKFCGHLQTTLDRAQIRVCGQRTVLALGQRQFEGADGSIRDMGKR